MRNGVEVGDREDLRSARGVVGSGRSRDGAGAKDDHVGGGLAVFRVGTVDAGISSPKMARFSAMPGRCSPFSDT